MKTERIVKTLRRKNHIIKVYEDPTLEKGFWALVWQYNRVVYDTNYQYTLADALELAKENAPGPDCSECGYEKVCCVCHTQA